MHREDGFTLVELMAVIMLTALLSLGAYGAMRNFWLNNALSGSRDEVASQLRQLQQRSQAESHPLVYGARFRIGENDYDTVRYNPATGTCRSAGPRQLEGGVVVSQAEFVSAAGITDICKAVSGWGSDHFVFFFARGSATSGTLTLTHRSIDKSLRLEVNAVTGRIEKP